MAHISYPFKKINKTAFQKPINLTNDSLHWKQFGLPVLVKEFGAVDYLDFSPVEPHYFAATCSVRVQVYDPITKTVSKNISKFVEAAYGATFRADGKLLVAGSEEKVVKLFDVQSKNVLRVFTGHTAPVHRTFFTKDQVKILSFSDDKSVGVWDIATEERIASFTEHTDYIRAGAASPVTPNLILSGGYDNLIKLYDCRSNETVLTVNHGSPVESLLYLPTGGVFISAGGTEIKVWDIFNGGKLLSNICQHHKTVTTLRLASNNSKLMSASLDRHVKIYDISTLKVIHNIDFPNAVLSMAISESDNVLAVGMVDGVISIRKREKPARKSKKVKGLFHFAPERSPNCTLDMVMKKEPTIPVEVHEEYLRKKQFTMALATVLKTFVTRKEPEQTAALLQELMRNNYLDEALSGLSDVQIGSLLKFFKKNVGFPLFTRTVIDSTTIFLNTFGNRLISFSEQNLCLLSTFIDAMDAEIEAGKLALEIEGMCRLLLSASQITSSNNLELNEHNVQLAPSSKAQKEIVIDV